LLTAIWGIGCKQNPAAQAEAAYARAHELLKKGKPEAAIIELNKAVQAKQDMAKAHHDLGKLYFERGDLNSSFREYSLAVRYEPQDQEALEIIGEVLLGGREFAKAKDIASQILARWPNDERAKCILAESLMALGEWSNAQAIVEQNASRNPKDARNQFNLAILMIHNKDWPGAERQLRLSTSLDLKSPVGSLVLARLLELQGKREDAENVLKQACAQHADQTQPLFALAGLYMRARRLPEAEDAFKKIKALGQKNPTGRASLGEFYLATEKTEAAEKEFQGIVAAYPDDRMSWHLLAETEASLNRRDEARRIAGSLLKKDDNDWRMLTLLGRMDLEDGKSAEAEQELNHAKTTNPDWPVIYFQLGRVYVAEGKFDLAKSALGQAVDRAPNYVDAHVLLAALELRSGQPDLAQQDLNKVLQQAPTAVEPNVMLSEAYAARGEFSQAEDRLGKLLNQPTTAAGQAMIFQTLSELKFRQNRFEEARRLALKSLNLGLVSREGLSLLGMSYLAQHHAEQGLKAVEDLLANSPQSAVGQDVVGEIALVSKNFDAAEKAYRTELQIKPSSSSALFGLGNVYDQRQLNDKAVEFFHRFALAEPNNATVHVRLGLLAERSQDFPQAISEYKEAINLDSANAIAKNNLAWIYAEHDGDLNIALRLAQEARRQEPNNANISDTLGWILVKMNLGQNALPYLKESVAKQPDHAAYHYHLGMACLKAGKKSDAKSELKAALQLGTPFAGSGTAKETLKDISNPH
jgi:tetratricopeptide (TPR) repeat protein